MERRKFLKLLSGATLGTAAWGVLPEFGGSLAWGAPNSATKIVSLLFDGGYDSMDYLAYDIPEALARRATVQRASSALISLGHPYLKLNNNFSSLYSAWGSKMAMFDCVNRPGSSGSHEQARYANAGEGGDDGWLGRMAHEISKVRPSPYIAWNFSSNDPEPLQNAAVKAIQAPSNLANYSFTLDSGVPGVSGANGFSSTTETRHRAFVLRTMQASAPAATSDVEANMGLAYKGLHDTVTQVRLTNSTFGAQRTGYPNLGTNPVADQLRAIATLIHGGLGEVFQIRIGGNDTHGQQITRNNTIQSQVNQALLAFMNDMNSLGELNKIIIMTETDFGRQIGENATAGTDHGHGAARFILGGRVVGGLYGTPATPSQIATGYALPRNTDPRILKTNIAQMMGIDPLVIVPSTFQNQNFSWFT
jgi:uncharacterized protein (DUF1501 family)